MLIPGQLQALPRINTKPLQAAFKQTNTHPESPGKLSVVSYDLVSLPVLGAHSDPPSSLEPLC